MSFWNIAYNDYAYLQTIQREYRLYSFLTKELKHYNYLKKGRCTTISNTAFKGTVYLYENVNVTTYYALPYILKCAYLKADVGLAGVFYGNIQYSRKYATICLKNSLTRAYLYIVRGTGPALMYLLTWGTRTKNALTVSFFYCNRWIFFPSQFTFHTRSRLPSISTTLCGSAFL